MDAKEEILDDHDSFKIRDIFDSETDEELWICWSYPFQRKTTFQFAERKVNLCGNCASQALMLYILFCEVFCLFLRKE